ncbi:uncharacterized protein LOC131055756, partial [Cryptomeria japonica]|uniref:uncharacterized protein LOC131055756 n=1 Tax=Cryptomeria japonica TaxID=3369 RepID=UPI0025AC04BD
SNLPGYGQSTGKPSEKNCYADIEATLRCLKEKYGVQEDRVILYGQSIGSGPSVDLAARMNKLGGVVLQGAILSGLRVIFPVKKTYYFDIFNNVDKIERVNCPVLVMHGTLDEVVDFSHGEQLWDLCKEKFQPLSVMHGRHNDLESFRVFSSHLKKFLSSVERRLLLSSTSESYRQEPSIEHLRCPLTLSVEQRSNSKISPTQISVDVRINSIAARGQFLFPTALLAYAKMGAF